MDEVKFNDLYLQYLEHKDEIDFAIKDCILKSEFVRGPAVENFENNFAALLGSKYCVSCANGTDALYIAMKSLGLEHGKEVITTALSWISTSETITQAGGKVVFCDIEPDTFTINTEELEEKISEKTVGIIPVHLYGHPAQMTAIQKIAKKYNLWVVEDCAQAHLAQVGMQYVGTFGNIGSFSFYPGKNLGAMGDAGCLITNDKQCAEWTALYSRHGGKGIHTIEGINSRLDSIQAAILNVKLKYLEKWTEKRRYIADLYSQLLFNIDSLEVPIVKDGYKHVYHLYVIKCKKRDQLKSFLQSKGIQTVINYPKALPFLPAYKYLEKQKNDFPVAYKLQDMVLSLPIFPEMSDSQVEFVCEQIKKFYQS